MIRMSRDSGSTAWAMTNALGLANGSAMIPSSARSSIGLPAIWRIRAWKRVLRSTNRSNDS